MLKGIGGLFLALQADDGQGSPGAINGKSQRARKVVLKYGKVNDGLGLKTAFIGAPECLKAGQLLEQGSPLVVVQRRANQMNIRQDNVVFDIKYPGDHVSPLNAATQLVKGIGFAPHHGGS